MSDQKTHGERKLYIFRLILPKYLFFNVQLNQHFNPKPIKWMKTEYLKKFRRCSSTTVLSVCKTLEHWYDGEWAERKRNEIVISDEDDEMRWHHRSYFFYSSLAYLYLCSGGIKKIMLKIWEGKKAERSKAPVEKYTGLLLISVFTLFQLIPSWWMKEWAETLGCNVTWLIFDSTSIKVVCKMGRNILLEKIIWSMDARRTKYTTYSFEVSPLITLLGANFTFSQW